MPYCTTSDVDNIIAQATTSATNPSSQAKRNLLQIGRVRDKNTVSDQIVEQYIQWACQEIDGHLSQLYKMPVCERVSFETKLVSDITEYNSYLVLESACPLTSGDQIILTDGDHSENHEIDESIGSAVFSTVEPIGYAFGAGTRVLHIKFPDPIPWIAVRLAAANLYDKYFASQASPNISEYGKDLRNQARSKINDIMNGRTILFGVERTGRLLYDPNLVEQYGLPNGTESNRDVDKLS